MFFVSFNILVVFLFSLVSIFSISVFSFILICSSYMWR